MYGKTQTEYQKKLSREANIGKIVSKETRKKMSDVKKGTTNAGSFKKGERRSKKTEFKKGQIPHNKGVTYSDERKKEMSITQIKKWDKLGRQSKEEKNRKSLNALREKRKDPKFLEEERKDGRGEEVLKRDRPPCTPQGWVPARNGGWFRPHA